MPKLHMALDDKVGDREIFIASLMVQYHFDTARAADSVAGEVLMCNMILGTWRGVCQQGGGRSQGLCRDDARHGSKRWNPQHLGDDEPFFQIGHAPRAALRLAPLARQGCPGVRGEGVPERWCCKDVLDYVQADAEELGDYLIDKPVLMVGSSPKKPNEPAVGRVQDTGHRQNNVLEWQVTPWLLFSLACIPSANTM